MQIQRIFSNGSRATENLIDNLNETNQDRLDIAVAASQEEDVNCAVLGEELDRSENPFATGQTFLAFASGGVVRAHKLDLS